MTEEPQDPFLGQRVKMVASQLVRRGIRDERVLAAMERVPRHEFIDPRLRDQAYDDEPVSIGEGQTISQPFMVAYMLEVLRVEPDNRVLEIGTGTGYEAALLADLAREVVTIERHRALSDLARQNLEQLGYHNVTVIEGDGSQGWLRRAPYDRIIVAAAAPNVPASLLDQLAEGGRLVAPIGSPEAQETTLVEKREGKFKMKTLDGCRFVPLIGAEGFTPRS